MPNGEQDSASRVLLVEGSTDMHVVIHICKRASIPDFNIDLKGSVEGLLESIPNEVRVDGRAALGIMLDANDHPSNRWEAVKGRLRKVGIEPPPNPQPEGVVIDSDPSKGLPRVGVWMMPDNESPGELENFLKEMLPPTIRFGRSRRRTLTASPRRIASSMKAKRCGRKYTHGSPRERIRVRRVRR